MYASHPGSPPPGEVSAHRSIWQLSALYAGITSIGAATCSVAIWLLLPPSSLWRIIAVLPFALLLVILAILLQSQPSDDQAKAAPGARLAYQQKAPAHLQKEQRGHTGAMSNVKSAAGLHVFQEAAREAPTAENRVTVQRATSSSLKRSTCGRLPRYSAPGPIASGPGETYQPQEIGAQAYAGRPVLLSVKSRLAYRSGFGWYDPGGLFLVDQSNALQPRETAFRSAASSGRLRKVLA